MSTQLQATTPVSPVDAYIERIRSYFNVGRREWSLNINDPGDVAGLVDGLVELFKFLAPYARSPKTRSKIERLATVLEEVKDKILEAVKKNDPKSLTDEEKFALAVLDVATRAAVTVLRGYERGDRDPAKLAAKVTRGMGAAIRAEWELDRPDRKYAATVIDWVKNMKHFDLPGVDDNKEMLQRLRTALEIRSRSGRAPVSEKEVEKELEKYIDLLKPHFEKLQEFIEKVNAMPEGYDKMLAEAQVYRYKQAVEALTNPQALWDIFKDAEGRPLYQRFVEAAQRSGRIGMASPKFIAWQYAWRILSGLYVPSNIAQRLGLDVPRLPRRAYSALRRLLSAELEKRINQLGLNNVKNFADLTPDQRAALANAIADAVQATLQKIGVTPAAA